MMNISVDFIKPVIGTFKKYTSLLPSIVITVVALLLLVPTIVVGNKVKKQMKQSVQNAGTLRSLLQDPPTRDKQEQVQNYINNMEAEFTEIKTLSQQGSQRELITYDYVLFPEPVDRSSQVYTEFGKQFCKTLEESLQGMNALDAPSEAEIRAETGTPRRRAGGGMLGLGFVGQQRTVGLSDDPVIDALCQKRAKEVSVYVNPTAFSWYDYWAEGVEFSGQDQAMEDCWDSQIAFWIYEDVIDTIKQINGSTDTVLKSPVKRLLGVSFNGPVILDTARQQGGFDMMMFQGKNAKGRDIPNYVTKLLPSYFVSASPTGRLGNEDLDIIHFAVAVVVDNRYAQEFMKELCSEKPHTFRVDFKSDGQQVQARHNQIAILQSRMSAVDTKSVDHDLYRYGNAAILRLDLVCEYQFDRSAYDAIKPPQIKERLGQEEAADSQPGTQPSGPGGMNPMMMF